jgi:hypothetical protein
MPDIQETAGAPEEAAPVSRSNGAATGDCPGLPTSAAPCAGTAGIRDTEAARALERAGNSDIRGQLGKAHTTASAANSPKTTHAITSRRFGWRTNRKAMNAAASRIVANSK